jgi:hypothetical protein
VECLFWSVWVVLSDAETSFQFARLLVVYREEGECCDLEDGAYLLFFCVYGGRETIGPLRTWRGPWKTYYPLVFIHCTFGLLRMSILCQLVTMISLFVFPFLVR